MNSRMHIMIFFSLLSVLALPAAAARRTDIAITADVATNAQRQLAGSGIVLPGGLATKSAQDSHGRAIVWREHKRATDPEGGVHVVYRQYLADGGIDAELVGGEVALHYDPAGTLQSVNGAQFESVHISNNPSLERGKAAARALDAFREHARAKSLDVGDIGRFQSKQPGVLEVRTGEQSGVQRFVWHMAIRDVGLAVDVLVDAQSEAVLATDDTMRLNACYPDSLSSVDAKSIPVRAGSGLPSSAVRWIGATPSSRNGYTHEAFWAVAGAPLFGVHQWMPIGNSAFNNFRCADQAGKQYGLIPIATGWDGYPLYTDDTLFQGRAAGDAMWQQFLTMDAFWRLGRNSFDGNYGNSTIVIDSPSSQNLTDTAWFQPNGKVTDLTASGMPPGASVNIAPAVKYWNAATSLDWIAHEWGHGVTEDQFDLTTSMGRTLSEGLSDVIGNIVEKTEQTSDSTANPAWSKLEQSKDWVMHEDAANGSYARGAEDDGPTGHTWVARSGTSRTFKDMIHRQDPDVDSVDQGHLSGNMLVMAMRLMSDGGKNPICQRLSTLQGCPATEGGISNPSITGIGFDKTSKIWWHAITNGYLGTSTTWNNIANSMLLAARSKYQRCPSTPALAEQNAVLLAFRYIGYPGTMTASGCP